MSAETPEILVVGAGIVGCSVAWELARRGTPVVVLEQAVAPFLGVSRAAFGSLTPFSDPYFDGDARDHAAKSVDLYRSLWLPKISADSGIPVTFQDSGLLELCASDADLVTASKHAANLQAAGYRADLLTIEDTRRLEPALSGAFAVAVLLDEPWIDVDEYFAALQLCLRKSPLVQMSFQTKVARVTTDRGHVVVHTAKQTSYTCDYAILCPGLQTIETDCGVPPPMKWIRGDALSVRTPDDRPLLQRHIYMKPGFITPRKNGRMLLGATYEDDETPPFYARDNLESVQCDQAAVLLESNRKILPKLSSCFLDGQWHNWRATPPDDMPVLGPIAGHKAIVLATGFIGLGITMAPATAAGIADYVLEGENSLPTVFDPQRFMKGTGSSS